MPFDPSYALLEAHTEHDKFVLHEALTYTGNEDTYTIPKGFHSDGASVPWFGRIFVPKTGRYLLPVLLHDFLYATQPCSRKDADGLFRRAMRRDTETRLWRMLLIYHAVRVGGWLHWRSDDDTA
jgi:hypothetical protein